MVWIGLMSMALAGYGDPVDGLPSPAEREMHLWTNAVRVDPAAFIDDYPCSFDVFSNTEQTPQMPLLWNYDLNDAARFHSDDMFDNDHFSHTSSDGTPFDQRLDRFYSGGTIGENIAWNYPGMWSTVIEGWMCSSGHRENIMRPEFDELGTGVTGPYGTQDFGSGARDLSAHPIRMGAHSPFQPLSETILFADWFDAFGRSVVHMEAIVNGDPIPMGLTWGTHVQGVYGVEIAVEAGPCYTYWFRAERSDGEVFVFPDDGAYGFGACEWDDADAMWMSRDVLGVEEEEEGMDPYLDADDGYLRDWSRWPMRRSCGHAPTPHGWLLLGLVWMCTRRRK